MPLPSTAPLWRQRFLHASCDRVSIYVVRAFVQLRSVLAAHKELAKRLEELEGKTDYRFKQVFEAIRELMSPPPEKKKRPIGFVSMQSR